MKLKILALSSKQHPGVTSVFRNMMQLGLCDYATIEDFQPGQETGYSLVLLGAWTNRHLEILNTVKIKKAIVWTSSLAQMELSPSQIENQIFGHIFDLLVEKKLDHFLLGDNRMATLWCRWHDQKEKIHHFPYPIYLKTHDKVVLPKGRDKPSVLGLFTAHRLGKNVLAQYYAYEYALLFNNELKLHTNIIKSSSPNLTFFDWLGQEAYEKEKDEWDIGLNVFVAESFCYTFSELMANGIPTLCSPSVANNFDLSNTIRRYLEIHDTEDLTEIAEKILNLTKMKPAEWHHFRATCAFAIREKAEKNNKALLKLMTTLTSN